MCPPLAIKSKQEEIICEKEDGVESQLQQSVKLLFERGVDKVPAKYILPADERPESASPVGSFVAKTKLIQLPLIDLAELLGPNRDQALKSLAGACQHYGFFQLVNHGIPSEVVEGMVDVSRRFFDLPYEERSNYMSSDLRAPVRCGTSFNQNKDKVFCWRDFLKLMCHPLPAAIHHWPSSPVDLRRLVGTYASETKSLFLTIMEAILESLSSSTRKREEEEEIMKEFGDGSHLMVVNCYPPCPEPDLTLGMPPHSDYGFLTLLLQDQVKGLQIQHCGDWVTVEPIPNSIVVNVGDHLEVQIFSNGRYKSVLHRVTVNAAKPRISVASLHSLSFKQKVRPWPRLVDEANPRRYEDTNFASFLDYISSREPKKKDFLDSRKISCFLSKEKML